MVGRNQTLYLDAIAQNPMVRILPQESLDNMMKVYNENAMRQILSWNTKEGDFFADRDYSNESKPDDERPG